MKSIFLLLAITAAATAVPEEFPGWKLMWNEEFEGGSIDSSKWSPCERGSADWNDTMTRDPRCFKVGGGTLKLIGIANPDTSQDKSAYLTGGVTSKGKFSFQQGRVLVRARFKNAKGAWPAIWMLGDNGSWPRNGEIDLMEHLNFDDKVYQTIHSHYANEVDKSQRNPPKGITTPIRRDDYNMYGADWDDQNIVFTVNGKPTLTYPRVPERGPDQWPFDQPFYLILSMQIEGKWVGKADPKDYPAHMEIDWVRVYQKSPGEAAPAAKPEPAEWVVADWSEWKLQETAPEAKMALVAELAEANPQPGRPPLGEQAKKAGILVLGPGEPFAIVKYEGKKPLLVDNYEISWEAMRVDGSDFFAALTFPVGSAEQCATFVAGGWGGWVTGVSCIDDLFANENETTGSKEFKQGKWYGFTLQVNKECLRALIDGKELFKVGLKGKTIGMHPSDIRKSMPLGFASFSTKGAVRNVRFRPLKAGELSPPEEP